MYFGQFLNAFEQLKLEAETVKHGDEYPVGEFLTPFLILLLHLAL